ncbi:hypothetical protein AMTR_s00148p00103230 [Amborella trichopoda]|uniref:Uncharacterized protein n=1 Tax=Amborella trichopoda TaxID=13333 RepID=W1PL60_AMBTC|nr:hypothetical protein AMTR_s00148p00103230 [Amborella trichopoda]
MVWESPKLIKNLNHNLTTTSKVSLINPIEQRQDPAVLVGKSDIMPRIVGINKEILLPRETRSREKKLVRRKLKRHNTSMMHMRAPTARGFSMFKPYDNKKISSTPKNPVSHVRSDYS